jgi:4-alpha-glucanotransferase
VLGAAHAFIASTASDLVFVQAEDLAGMTVGVNLPGTDTERPNWRRKVPIAVETLLNGATAQTILNKMRDAGRGARPAADGSGPDPAESK